MVGLANNYLIYELTDKLLEKPGMLDSFESVNFDVEDFDIKELILKYLEHDGIVYGVKENGTLKAVFIFELKSVKKKGKVNDNKLKWSIGNTKIVKFDDKDRYDDDVDFTEDFLEGDFEDEE